MKKAFTWSAPICALVTGLALTMPGPAAASVARPVSQPAYTTFKDAALNGVLAVSVCSRSNSVSSSGSSPVVAAISLICASRVSGTARRVDGSRHRPAGHASDRVSG
jgi:hypothetical protein